MTKLKFESFYDDDGNIRAIAVVKTCPDCGEQYVSTILTDGSDDELEDFVWDSGMRDYLVEDEDEDEE